MKFDTNDNKENKENNVAKLNNDESKVNRRMRKAFYGWQLHQQKCSMLISESGVSLD